MRMLVGRRRMVVASLGMPVGGCGMFLCLIMAPVLMMMRSLTVVMRSSLMVRCCIVMMFAGRMLGRSHFVSSYRSGLSPPSALNIK